MGIHASLEGGPEGALPPILTVEEVADLMRIDRKTAYAAIACGEVPGVRRIGRCIRISRDVLLRWLEHSEAKSAMRGRQ
jgi:excisionase family DNA binding protein